MARITPICKRALLLIGLGLAGGTAVAGDRADRAAFVRARLADASGDVAGAARDYARALAAAPAEPIVALRAYRAGLEAGDIALAQRARRVIETGDEPPLDTPLMALAEAVAARDPVASQAVFARMRASRLNFLVAPLTAWLGFERDPAAAIAALDAAGDDPVARRLASDARALMLVAIGRDAEAVAMLRARAAIDAAQPGVEMDAARLFAGRGALAQARGFAPGITAASGAGATPSFGIASLFAGLAGDLTEESSAPFAIAAARAALILDPGSDRARLALAAALGRRGSGAAALAVLDGIAPVSPLALAARGARVETLRTLGREDDALALARTLAAAPGAGSADARRAGELLAARGDTAGATAAFREALERAGPAAGWEDYLRLGSAVDEGGNWPAARKLFDRAVALAPDNPFVLNYVGYERLMHDDDALAARALIEQANRLKPDDPAILDSLGWALFRSGDVAGAVPLLERAAAGDSDNGEIQEHLGDVYWRLGRAFEARYAWTAALTVAQGDDLRRLRGKIGLDAGLAAP